jgi:hypothetical protein
MRIRQLSIVGYRGFSKQQTLALAQPLAKLGSGLTVLVGPNNAGKSSVIEAINYLRAPGRQVEISEGQKSALTNGRVTIEYATDEGDMTLTLVGAGPAQWRSVPDRPPMGHVYAIQSRRALESQFNINNLSRKNYVEHSPDFASRRSQGSTFATRLSAMDSNSKELQSLLRRVLPDPPNWYIERIEGGLHYMKVTSAGAPHNSDGLGQGIASVLHIVDALYDSSPGDVIAIDEPELSLHPAAQRRLALVLAEFAKDRQIILATHSPFFAPLEYLANGATIARVSVGGRAVIINQLSRDTAKAIGPLLLDKNNPHVLGIDAREVFFLEDNVILVEGQEDVISYRSVFEQLSAAPTASFFGWGVGGASKMKLIAKTLQDLGLRRVFGILDRGQEDLLQELRDTFPTFAFCSIPAPDVRTKPARPAQVAKDGLLDVQGMLRGEHQVAMEVICSNMAQYFNQGGDALASNQ